MRRASYQYVEIFLKDSFLDAQLTANAWTWPQKHYAAIPTAFLG